jgi:hypothetical protein
VIVVYEVRHASVSAGDPLSGKLPKNGRGREFLPACQPIVSSQGWLELLCAI